MKRFDHGITRARLANLRLRSAAAAGQVARASGNRHGRRA